MRMFVRAKKNPAQLRALSNTVMSINTLADQRLTPSVRSWGINSLTGFCAAVRSTRWLH